MDIVDKLKYYSDNTQAKVNKPKEKNLQKIAKLVNGTVIKDNALPFIKRETIFSFKQLQIDDFNQKYIHLAILTKGDYTKPINLANLLFFDLETTGLAGGAGTYPFLIGISFFDKKCLNVIQYFLPEFDRDIFAYLDIKRYVKNKSILVSYNGKSFDYPLLKNRFILNRFENIFKKFDHIDLLHLSRRVWKNSLENCSLGNIEQSVFKFSRLNDIDGALIPQTYFDYLRTGRNDNVVNTILHNEQDLVSLGRLIVFLSKIENDVENSMTDESELLSLFYTAIKSGSLSNSKYYLELINRRKIDVPQKFMLLYSYLLKKHFEWDNCIIIWEKLIQSEKYALTALEELAKYYEHKLKDFRKAHLLTKRAISLVDVLIEINSINILNGQFIKDKWQHRLYRLNSRLKAI